MYTEIQFFIRPEFDHWLPLSLTHSQLVAVEVVNAADVDAK